MDKMSELLFVSRYCGLKATKYDRRVSTTYISGTLVGRDDTL